MRLMHERIATNEAVHGIVRAAAIADQRAGTPRMTIMVLLSIQALTSAPA